MTAKKKVSKVAKTNPQKKKAPAKKKAPILKDNPARLKNRPAQRKKYRITRKSAADLLNERAHECAQILLNSATNKYEYPADTLASARFVLDRVIPRKKEVEHKGITPTEKVIIRFE